VRVRFGDFTFDSGRRELRAGSASAHLTPKAFRLLEVLLKARPKALSKQYLYEHLWPETFVGDTNLKMLVSVLRIVLKDDVRDPKWVKTRIAAPKMMLHGRYDEDTPFKSEAEPLFRLLREPKRTADL
jgi:DNA-binding winged helix-turn-helix (wHTH) protein